MMVCAWLVLIPALAGAQSVISGVVTDTTTGTMPGVTVEASSPALIEKTRTVITDGAGVYRIENLPPGTYAINFSLEGFSPFRRDGIELPSNFTATINAELKVGGIGETIVVSGGSPVVDTQSTARSNVVNREQLDLLPTGRTVQTAGALVHTTVMSAPDVGGSGAMTQNFQTTAGMQRFDVVVTLDGIQMQGFDDDGASQAYVSPMNYEEIVFESNAAGADQSGGGIRQNLIPRRGGNTFSGQLSVFYMNRSWQGDPLTQDLVNRGLRAGPQMDGLNNVEGAVGGRLIRDKVWFFASGRRMEANKVIPGAAYADGSPGIQLDKVTNKSGRLTWQINPANQITGYYDWVVKDQLLGVTANTDVGTVATPSHSSPYALAQVKWTSTPTKKLMIEAGFNDYRAFRKTRYSPGVLQEPFTDAWYAMANRTDLATSRQTTASANGDYLIRPQRHLFDVSATYVTGSHSFKFGVQNNWGSQVEGTTRNADLNQQYQNGVPAQVQIYNTPVLSTISMSRNVGLYVQDSWRIQRLTVNAGLRWEDYQAEVGSADLPAGRFVPARNYDGETLPSWSGWAPRFGATYDLFGNAKTALKFSANRFQNSLTGGLAFALNPIRQQNVTAAWTDLNHDDIAQGQPGCTYLTPGCEINLAQVPANFGVVKPGCTLIYSPGSIPCGNDQLDPNVPRGGAWQYSGSVQHELFPRVSVTAGYVRANFFDIRASDNVLQSFSDFTPVDIANPIDGSTITVYNVSADKRSQVLNVLKERPGRSRWNNSFDAGFNARLGHGMTMFGGVLVSRTLENNCDVQDDPNRLIYCDQSKNDIPWKAQFKIAGTMMLPWDISLSAAFQTYRNDLSTTAGVVWQITPTTRYPANCAGACTPGALVNPGMTVSSMNVPLEAPFTRLSDRVKQLDLTVGRSVRIAGLQLRPELSAFNVLNNLSVYGVRSLNYGTSAYLVPSQVLQPRLFRVGLQVKW
jgi:hypothetical protein